MDTIYMLFLGAIGIILAIGVGIKLSENIDEFIIVFLFWLLYIITIATFINIILVVNYYLTMRNKKGIQGIPGPEGDQGDTGKSGVCDPGCRDSICEIGIREHLMGLLKAKNPDFNGTRFNNIYIKGKIKQMCSSKEFKQLVPYNGPQNLINYLKDIWTIWFELLYDAGELSYFENVAAETEFEWTTDNPFNELKKYDVFYWGLGKQYRPNIVEKCFKSNDGNTVYNGIDNPLLVSITNMYTQLGTTNAGVLKLSFWRAQQFTYKGIVYYPVGDIIVGPVDYKTGSNDSNNYPFEKEYNDSVIYKRHVGEINFDAKPGPKRETIIVSGPVAGPSSYELVWNNSAFADANNQFWLWRPIPPSGYVSLGDVVTFDASMPPTGDSAPIRCVSNTIAIVTSPNGKTFYSQNNIMILGFNPNDSNIHNIDLHTAQTHCYNMFRAVVGSDPTHLPPSDANGSFYYLDTTKFDAITTIGMDYGQPSIDKDNNQVGKGYIPFPTRGTQYSILKYLNLQNTATLKHTQSQISIYATIIEGAISNNYILSTLSSSDTTSCLNFDGNTITPTSCDKESSSQTFSINFTGNKSNECTLQHNDTGDILCYVDATFKLVDQNDQTPGNYDKQLFIIQ